MQNSDEYKKNKYCEHINGNKIRYLNKKALEIADANSILYEHIEEEYINFRIITNKLTDKLADIGVLLFVILNETGWGDMPTDTISDLQDELLCDLYYYPILIGNLIADGETLDRNIYCSHFNVVGKVKTNTIKICKEVIGKNFEWNESDTSKIILKF